MSSKKERIMDDTKKGMLKEISGMVRMLDWEMVVDKKMKFVMWNMKG